MIASVLRTLLWIGVLAPIVHAASPDRRLYVAAPGIRNYLEFGGHGILVFDIDHDYRCLRRIPAAGLNADGQPMNVKGIAVSVPAQRLYVTTLSKLACYDLTSDTLVWERAYEGGCDRLAISPDGKSVVVPSLEKSFWNLIDPATGDILKRFDGYKSAHNTIVSLDGTRAYLADRHSPLLAEVDLTRGEVSRAIGPFSHFIRPFTINRQRTRAYVCVDDLLGFEIGDLTTGKKLHRVEVQGFSMGPVKRHSCPSHGVGLTPDEKQVWVVDATHQRLHVFDNTVEPPRQIDSLEVREQPGWITFRLDGRHAWPSTGDVVDVDTRKIVARLADETGAPVHSEKMIELHFTDGRLTAAGDQFGLGRKE
ncbi:MAG: YncE family protein [Limisphaerales bacterium]